MNRDLARAARRLADQQSSRISTAGGTRQVIATVTTATAGGAKDGVSYLVKVTWRGIEFTAAGYLASYTPAMNHRVVVAFIDNQPIVLGRIVGQP